MTDSMQNLINQAEQDLLHTYNRYQIVLERGEGVHLYDTDGKEYLDFVAGIAVFALGYHFPGYDEALKAQIDKILHTSNYYYNEPAIRAAHLLKEASQMDRVFFTNSGAEAVEGALKAALKYAYTTRGADDYEVIAMEHSFHGRTYGALSVTGNAHYREAFGTMPCNVRFANLNDLESVKALVTGKTAAVIVEPVQGEGGLIPATEEFLWGLRNLTREHNICLIFDEVQCGMGRTGYLYAWQKYGIRPDIMATAKALGCGVPVGAFLLTEECAKYSLVPGDHGTTYGGNPFACAAVAKVLELYKENDICGHVREVSPYLTEKLKALAEKYDCILGHRGTGLMQGLVFDRPVSAIIAKAMEDGLILINAGTNILRFVPPLVIEKADIDRMIEILEPVIAGLSS